ncbi:MAG: methionine synthase [Clostridia bacterium]|nr:methionine synthase [Clostridia bacterium]
MDAAEAARYLRWPEDAVTGDVLRQLEDMGRELEAAAPPRLVWRVLPRTPEGCEGLCLPGGDIRALLGDAEQVIIAACTLGEAASRAVRRAFLKDMARGVMADACLSAIVEEEMDRFEKEQARAYFARGLYLTDRFSPGYGDLPLSVQKDLCALLDTPRALGLTVNESMLLIPEKSVTAVMGICPAAQKHRAATEKSGCARCAAFENCVFRLQGRTCHG